MPPSTRREVRLSASLPSPSASNMSLGSIEPSRSGYFLAPNMEAILENFEQFKRKHISQNREVIKANALAQQRIRELENRIQTLESEKLEQALAVLPLKAQLGRFQHSFSTIRSGWEIIAQELDLASTDTRQSSLSRTQSLSAFDRMSCPPSNKVTLDVSLQASGVVKTIARPPEIHLQTLAEADEIDTKDTVHKDWQAQSKPLSNLQNYLQSIPSPSSGFVLDVGGAPSPMGSPGLPIKLVAPFVDQAQADAKTTAFLSNTVATSAGTSPYAQPEDSRRVPRSGRKSGRRQSGLLVESMLPTQSAYDDKLDQKSNSDQPLLTQSIPDLYNTSWAQRGATSDSGLSLPRVTTDFHTDHAVTQEALSDITDSIGNYAILAKFSARKARRQTMDVDAASIGDASTKSAVTPAGRKRKTPALDTFKAIALPMHDCSVSETVSGTDDVDHEPQTGRTRRMRKSVNYALPKLNTKMRKPGPDDTTPVTTPPRATLGTPQTIEASSTKEGGSDGMHTVHDSSITRRDSTEITSLALRQGSPSRSAERKRMYDEDGSERQDCTEQADLFEVKRRDNLHKGTKSANRVPTNGSSVVSQPTGSTWTQIEFQHTSSDDDGFDSHAVSIERWKELDNTEDVLSDSSADEAQIPAPRASTPSSPLSAQLQTPSSDSLYMICTNEVKPTSQKISLKKKTISTTQRVASIQQSSKETVSTTSQQPKNAPIEPKTVRSFLSQPPERGPAGLVAGMKPKQRPSGAGPVLTDTPSKPTYVSVEGTMPKMATTADWAYSAASRPSGNASNRSAGTSTGHRVGLHSTLTNQLQLARITTGMTDRGFPAASTPFPRTQSKR